MQIYHSISDPSCKGYRFIDRKTIRQHLIYYYLIHPHDHQSGGMGKNSVRSHRTKYGYINKVYLARYTLFVYQYL